jgi:hypothetical protein
MMWTASDGSGAAEPIAPIPSPDVVLEGISAEINEAAIFPLSTREVFFFAFDLLLDQGTISRHVKGLIPERIVQLPGHKLDFAYFYPPIATALPTVTRTNDPKDSVWGILYNAKDKDFGLLEQQLRVPNRYHRRQIYTLDRGGRRFPAFTYVLSLHDEAPRMPSARYLLELIAAARERGLPPDYLRFLEEHPTGTNEAAPVPAESANFEPPVD